MKTALLHETNDLRTFVLVLGSGDETMSALAAFAAENRLKASQFSAIGAFERAVVAYFEWESKRYRHIPLDEQVEVLSIEATGRFTEVAYGHRLDFEMQAAAAGVGATGAWLFWRRRSRARA